MECKDSSSESDHNTNVCSKFSARQSRASLAIDGISIITASIQQNQAGMQDLLEKLGHDTALHSSLLTNALQSRATTSDVSQRTTTTSQNSASQGLHGSNDQSGLKIQAHLVTQARGHCSTYCRCRCHMRRTLRSPALFRPLFGRLFVGYHGSPTDLTSSCSTISCESQLGFKGCVQYYFPSWFCDKVLEIAMCTSRTQEPKVSLTVRGVQPLDAEIWTTIMMDDDQAIYGLLKLGLARPNDIRQQSGLSLLAVGHFSVILPMHLLSDWSQYPYIS